MKHANCSTEALFSTRAQHDDDSNSNEGPEPKKVPSAEPKSPPSSHGTIPSPDLPQPWKDDASLPSDYYLG